MKSVKRTLAKQVLKSMKTMPAVFISGPRQAGKSTMAQMLIENESKAHYTTFDNPSVLAAAVHDPSAFLEGLSRPVVIDEVQMVPELFRVLKQHIDKSRQQHGSKANGQFLLTGSANIMALPELADALVGRMAIHTLYPFSYGEVMGKPECFVKNLLSVAFDPPTLLKKSVKVGQVIKQATFPQIAFSNSKMDATQWFQDYLITLLQRDVKSLAEIDKLSVMPNILKMLADRSGSLLNDSSLARDVGLNQMTYRRYRILLDHLFLTLMIVPWFRNIGKRLVKSPKIYFTDTYLLCHLLGMDPIDIEGNNPKRFGHILENLIASEITKQLSILNDGSLYHYRSHDGKEIDFIIEKRNGSLVALEVKARRNVSSNDFANIKMLQEAIGGDFLRGIVLYGGEETLPFGKNCYAIPYSAVWESTK